MRRAVLNTALARATRARGNPEHALAVWRSRTAEIIAAAGIGPDADDRAFIDDLGFLLQSFARVPGLTPIGWTVQLHSAEQRLENRLRIKRIHAQHPLVAAEPIERPLFIIGLPRTASTLLHRLLAEARGHRAPLLWELQHTGLDRDAASAARSRTAVHRQAAMLARLGPDYNAIHPLHADRPEESIALLWRTYFPLSCAPLPDYRARLEQADLTADYTYLKQALQVLQHGRERRRWVLKFPGHAAHLDVIGQVFPDSRFVWSHRDPAAAVGSFCSLVEALHAVHCKGTDPAAIGRTWLEILAESIHRGRKLRRVLPEEAITDVSYHRLVSDPHRYAPRLFEQIGAEWTLADRNRVDALTRRSGPGHAYTLEHYGLRLETVEEAFGDYRAQVGSFQG